MPTQVSIDPDLCIGSGDCARLVPSAFRVDEDQGIAVTLEGVATTDPTLLLRAAEACPTQAIRVVAEDGTVLHE